MKSLLDPQFATRRRIKVGLTIAGFFAGATFGLVITRIGKLVADAPPGTLKNYLWNAAVFGILSAIISPVISWSSLRRAPLWRTVVEPLLLAVAGAVIALIFAVPVLILFLPPAGLIIGFASLAHRYPGSAAPPEPSRIDGQKDRQLPSG